MPEIKIISKYILKLLEFLRKINFWKLGAIVFVLLFVVTQLFSIRIFPDMREALTKYQENRLTKSVVPAEGITLPIQWGELGMRLIETGVIDAEKFESLYEQKGGIDEETRKVLYSRKNGFIKITPQNAQILLNIFWALGLANKNEILEEGPMTDEQYGGDASRFASTGGWSLARGDVMDHYSKHSFVVLNSEQQELVERVSKNIYRPCCGNSTYFPDCNHGMAMLGFLQLLASQDATEKEMYKTALEVNSYWFPDTYVTIAKYMKEQDTDWKDVDAKTVLGYDYSSSGGYRGILAEVNPVQQRSGGGSCGV